jgi:hypothetical protein
MTVAWRFSKAHTWSATVLVNELEEHLRRLPEDSASSTAGCATPSKARLKSKRRIDDPSRIAHHSV